MSRQAIGELGLKDMYKLYKSTVENPVDWKVYRDVCHMANKKIAQKVLEGRSVQLPYLNRIEIRKHKQLDNRKNFDYGHYNKTGVKRLHTNDHSAGFVGRWHWKKSLCKIAGKTPFSFQPTRDNQRECSAQFSIEFGHSKYAESNLN